MRVAEIWDDTVEITMKTMQELSAQERNVLADFRAKVGEAFSGVPARYTLFGSRARGDADAESDLEPLLEP
jgi:predicted nucleotidyltransferase